MVEEIEDFLEHHGIKGQKWGIRNSKNRELNKASRANDKAQKSSEFKKVRESLRPTTDTSSITTRKQANNARSVDIQRARDRISSGALRADRKEAKAQFKKDKITMGSREARKIFRYKKDLLANDVLRSNQAKNGAEMAGRILNTLAIEMQNNQRNKERNIQRAKYGLPPVLRI